ncbi:MAG: pyridoxamine 5'-phosphate oxidase family protein [Candidatus Cloacimonetes bacterium]|nr:pyridoxamine 5'-phosphate oxidase family protein [Candidatus Cloacimonadota bacterium]
MNEIRKKIEENFEKMQPVYFATALDNQPSLRPVTLIRKDNDFFIATSNNDAKIQQVKSNSKIEFCLPLKNKENIGYIRGLGIAEIISDSKVKEDIFNFVPCIKEFWKSASDENYALLKLQINLYDYLEPGKWIAEKIDI